MAPLSRLAVLIAAIISCSIRGCAAGLNQQYMGGDQLPFEFRAATIDDIDDMVTVFIEAFSVSPAWQYIHQFEDAYPGYTWHCTRDSWRDSYEKSGSNATFRVISVPDETAASGSRVVSFSIWEFNKTGGSDANRQSIWSMGNRTPSWANCSAHLDVNMTRVEDYVKQGAEAEDKYLNDVYDCQDYLALLATHPKWDGNGFAAVHLQWGMALADKTAIPTTLLATPAGYPLYKSLGFKDIYNQSINRLDGKGTFWHEIMVHFPEEGS
ncbi:hypothetical protein PFICI_04405 [Pestalotiopsis fici W106-1]|uniref:N-acetyltransferase domain-containing protein n=1 Tax=Pestalotiopsis fici (strain W106-1 / CGMCC3.15140) TaxID=1229662 RepID=W3X925_PESFW|nr:uncharacterized protein PFICI_04405 [Pestalotiopsis fici W106-1]ETS82529.1 hypothetical protein PFICI_04405 [Pestalotiopsis fici W106-1]